jgi:HTH-type transcriptional regulator/antitoxin HigA
VGISPGIVVGQLQHFGRIKRNHYNHLRRRYRWDER